MGVRRYSILIVDDDGEARIVYRELLEAIGHHVEVAADGREALELLRLPGRVPRPCLVFADVMMPVMGGAELHARARADPQLADIPFLMVTAAGVAALRALGLEGVPWLRKPFGLNELEAALPAVI